MTAAILAILAALVPFVVWLERRRIEAESSPEEKQRDRIDAYEREIIENDERGANISLDDELERLRASALQIDPRGPDCPPPPGRSDLDGTR